MQDTAQSQSSAQGSAPGPDQNPTNQSPFSYDPPFYQVATEKFIELTLVTFGLFGFFWTYRNWQIISRREKGIYPLWFTLLSVFYQGGLYRRIASRAALEDELVRWNPARLSAIFIIFTVLPVWMLLTDHPWGILINLMTLLPNLLVNQTINRVHERHMPFFEQNTELSALDWTLIVAGLIGWLTILVLALASDFV